MTFPKKKKKKKKKKKNVIGDRYLLAKKIQKNTKKILIYYLHKLRRHSKMFNKDSKCL